MSVGVDSGSDGLMRALRAIEDGGVGVEDVAMRQPNLDEVFLALTGRSADPAEPAGPDAAQAA